MTSRQATPTGTIAATVDSEVRCAVTLMVARPMMTATTLMRSARRTRKRPPRETVSAVGEAVAVESAPVAAVVCAVVVVIAF